MATTTTHPGVGFVVFFWVNWIHSCTEMRLSPFLISPQRGQQSWEFWEFSRQPQVLVSPQLGDDPQWILLCGLLLGQLDPFMH